MVYLLFLEHLHWFSQRAMLKDHNLEVAGLNRSPEPGTGRPAPLPRSIAGAKGTNQDISTPLSSPFWPNRLENKGGQRGQPGPQKRIFGVDDELFTDNSIITRITMIIAVIIAIFRC